MTKIPVGDRIETILRDLLIDALPYVEAAQNEHEHKESERQRARQLSTSIRQIVEAMTAGYK